MEFLVEFFQENIRIPFPPLDSGETTVLIREMLDNMSGRKGVIRRKKCRNSTYDSRVSSNEQMYKKIQ